MVDIDAQDVPATMVPNLLHIIRWPDERLHLVCKPVTLFDDWLDQFALDLFATMKHNDGIGLAAPQVGIPIRAFGIWIETDIGPTLFVNPEITWASNIGFSWEEGCLSVPGYFEQRKRPNRILVQFQDIKGKHHETEFDGLCAFAIQHELDHLDGNVFVDGSSKLKTSRIKNKMKKFLRKKV